MADTPDATRFARMDSTTRGKRVGCCVRSFDQLRSPREPGTQLPTPIFLPPACIVSKRDDAGVDDAPSSEDPNSLAAWNLKSPSSRTRVFRGITRRSRPPLWHLRPPLQIIEPVLVQATAHTIGRASSSARGSLSARFHGPHIRPHAHIQCPRIDATLWLRRIGTCTSSARPHARSGCRASCVALFPAGRLFWSWAMGCARPSRRVLGARRRWFLPELPDPRPLLGYVGAADMCVRPLLNRVGRMTPPPRV